MPEEEKTSTEESKSSDEGTDKGTDEQKEEGLTDEQVEALKSDERLQKWVQSEADKRTATIERRLRTERAVETAKFQRRREDEELMGLVEREDYEGLGQRRAEEIKRQRTLSDAAAQVSGAIEGVLTEHPEFRALGEERVEEIRQEISARNGTVVDFMVALSSEKQKLAVGSAVEQAKAEFSKEIDARFAEAGLTKRSEGGGPDASVSAGGGAVSDKNEDALLTDPNTDIPTLKTILKKRGIKT